MHQTKKVAELNHFKEVTNSVLKFNMHKNSISCRDCRWHFDKCSRIWSDFIVNVHLYKIWRDKYVNRNGYTVCDAKNIPKSCIYEHIFIDKDKANKYL